MQRLLISRLGSLSAARAPLSHFIFRGVQQQRFSFRRLTVSDTWRHVATWNQRRRCAAASPSVGSRPSATWSTLLTLNNLSSEYHSLEEGFADAGTSEDAWCRAVCQWWFTAMRQRLFPSNGTTDSSTVADAKEPSLQSTSVAAVEAFPVESAEVALMVQALALTLRRLHAFIARETAASNAVEMASTTMVREMEATMLYLVRTRLPYFSVVREAAPSTEAEGFPEQPDDAVASAVAVVDKATQEARALSLRRGERERVKELVVPYAPEELLQMTVLLETIQSVLHVADLIDAQAEEALRSSEPTNEHRQPLPSLLSHETRAVLYSLGVTALSAVEQLPAPTLAALSICMAQTAESYALTLQLVAHVPKRDADSGALAQTPPLVMPSALEEWTPHHFLRHGHGLSPERQSALMREAAVLGGELATTIKPTEVLGHLSVLANEVTRRVEAEWDVARADPLYADFLLLWRACVKGRADEDRSAEDVRVRQQSAKEAVLGLRSLAERKALTRRQQAGTATTTSRRGNGRRASSSVTATAPEPLQKAEHTGHDDEEMLLRLTLSDVAEMCTAMASLRFLSDAPFWHSVTRYAVWVSYSFSEALDAAASTEATAGTSDNTISTEEQVSRFLKEMRDVAFALDHVRRFDDYDAVMRALVQLRFLKAPIPPPSASLKTMRDASNRPSAA